MVYLPTGTAVKKNKWKEEYMAVRMVDIARKVGVSRQAVSAVLNHPESCRISSKVQEEIRRIAAELGYIPNVAAKLLKGAASGTVGVIDSSLEFGSTTSFFQEILADLQKANMDPIVQGFSNDRETIKELIHKLEMRGVDGIILNTISPEMAMPHLHVPSVFLSRSIFFDCDVATDYITGGKMAVEHLYAHGRRKIALLAVQSHSYSFSHSRYTGWKNACTELGLPCGDDLLFYGEKFNYDFDILVRKLVTMKVDAVFCHNDQIAGKLIYELTARNVTVPDDIAVIGFDGMSFCDFCKVPLATVIQPLRKKAQLGVELLLDRIRNNIVNAPLAGIFIEPILLPSRSCGCPERRETRFDKLNNFQTIEMGLFRNFGEELSPVVRICTDKSEK